MNHYVWKLGSGCDRTKRNLTEKKELLQKANEVALQNDIARESLGDSSNKPMAFIKETNNIKISEREPVIQSNLNPFLISDNYITHLETQDKFLRPQDSNYQDSNYQN